MPLPKSLQTSTAWSTFLKVTLVSLPLAFHGAAHAEEPRFTHLVEGEVAPFQGYLLAPEAVGQVISVDDERRLKELADLKLSFDEERALLQRDLKLQGARIERLEGEALVVADARSKEKSAYEEEIKRMRRKAFLYAVVGFAAGGAAVGVATLF
jgi:hypothetical protein